MFLILFLLTVTVKCSHSSYLPEGATKNSIPLELSKMTSDLRNRITYCLHNASVIQCFKTEILSELDKAINDNSAWQLNDQIMVKRNPEFKNKFTLEEGRSFENAIKSKLSKLLESRIMQFQFPSDVDEAGRKKKDKHGNGMMMMSGVAIMAMMAQMFLGKVAFMAGAALLIAKIALLFSTLSGLKKGGGGSHGGGEHVVYSDISKTSGGWQRSIHQPHLLPQTNTNADTLAYGIPEITDYDRVAV